MQRTCTVCSHSERAEIDSALIAEKRKPPLPATTRRYSLSRIQSLKNKTRALQLKKAFLKTYSSCGHITEAAPAAGISRMAHYRWLESDPVYAEQFRQLKADVHAKMIDELERELHRRAVEGVEEPVFGSLGCDAKGKSLGTGIVGKVRKYSDTLLIFKLRSEERRVGKECRL